MPVYQQALLSMKQLNLETFNDYELIYLAKENHEIAYEILQKKYEPIIISISKKIRRLYPNIGLDLQDYVLEGKVALTNAIDHFDEEHNNLFYTYVTKCIRFALLSLVHKNRKDYCLNSSLEWIDELQISRKCSLASNLQIKEMMNNILIKLSPLEKKVLTLKIKGFSYQNIADYLSIDKKKVDNILLKVRNIIKEYRKE